MSTPQQPVAPALDQLDPGRPCAIVADDRTPRLVDALEQLRPRLPRELSLWTPRQSDGLRAWAAGASAPVVTDDEHEIIALTAPGLDRAIPVSRRLLGPVQLVFLGRNEISCEGAYLGAVYSMLNLVPRQLREPFDHSLPDLLLELYRRFAHAPAVLPAAAGGGYVDGDAWALDEAALAGLDGAGASLHEQLRQHFPRPPAPTTTALAPPPRTADAAYCRTALARWTERRVTRPPATLVRAGGIFLQLVATRLKRRLRGG